MIEAELPDGTILEFPDGTSPDVMRSAVQRMGKAAKPSFGEQLKKEVVGSLPVQLGLGAIRGAGSIGATLKAPFDYAEQGIAKLMGADMPAPDRRKAMDAALQSMGADPSSVGYNVGKIGNEIAGTAGIGWILARGAESARFALSVVDALRTGGMSAAGKTGLASIPARVVSSAAVGGASAGVAGGADDIGMGAALGIGATAIPAVAKMGGALLRHGIGASTGVGADALGQAFKAGQSGGKAAQQFTKNMRGGGEYDDVLNMAKQNLQAMQQQKQAAYRQGMQGIKSDKSVLDMTPISQAISNASSKVSFKGQAKNPRAAQALQEAADEVSAWQQLDPAEYHTPEGLDALKQRIGGILESLPFEQKTARTAVGDVYNSVKGEINKQAPTYAEVMGGYGKASETIKEIERALSLGQRSSADTGMRKLQSLMRNNVNTNYGQRTQLASDLIGAGGQDFMPALAGQSLSDIAPRGMQRAAAGVGVPSMAFLGNIPAAAGLLAVSSPRLMGETFYGAGKLADQRLLEALRQSLPKMPILAAQSEQ